jgi:hypothetical protein
MAGLPVDIELLEAFERGLDPRRPERSAIPARVLGYGEMTTVFEIGEAKDRGLAYKRLAMFRTEDEARQYESLYTEYIHLLRNEIGVDIVASDIVHFTDKRRDRVVAYIVQENIPVERMGNRVIEGRSEAEAVRLVRAVLEGLKKVFDFNASHRADVQVGIDGQISNWALAGDPGEGALGGPIALVYLDTSTPLVKKSGKDQLDPELFLRSAPSFLVWIIRLLFLEDVMTRYYDFRKVVIDLLANLYKEQREELIPRLLAEANAYLAEDARDHALDPISRKEVKDYYREDVWIWRTYLGFRKIDRFLHRCVGKHYPYILPARIRR